MLTCTCPALASCRLLPRRPADATETRLRQERWPGAGASGGQGRHRQAPRCDRHRDPLPRHDRRLAQLDLAYSPQYGSAKDAIHYAAFVAQNQRSGLTPAINPRYDIKDLFVLDVRTPKSTPKAPCPTPSTFPWTSSASAWPNSARSPDRRHLPGRPARPRGHALTPARLRAVNVKGGYAIAGSMK